MIRRLILIGLAAIVVLLGIAVGGLHWFLSRDGIRLALEQQASGWLGQPVHIGAARAQIFPRVAIRLDDVRVGEPARVTLAEVEVSTALRALLERRIVDAE